MLDLKPQFASLKDQLLPAIQNVIESGIYINGPEVQNFEREAAEYLGVRHVVGCNSGTDALLMGLRGCGVSPGDEVITPAFSFFASAETISNVGADPVFADVDLTTFNIDPEDVRKKITPRTKAIMPVHLFGAPAPMDEIRAIAEEHNIKIIEDCAQSIGAVYDPEGALQSPFSGKQTGNMGVVGAFSFYPTKNLGACGDAGMLATNDDSIAELARMLRNHGDRSRYRNEILGYNSRLDAVQAAALRVKLPHIDKWNTERRRVAAAYNTHLEDDDRIQTPQITPGCVFHQYTIRITSGDRDAVQSHLRENGVGTMVYYPIPQNRLPVYEGQFPSCPNSELLAQQVLSLPIWPELDEEHIAIVAERLKNALSA